MKSITFLLPLSLRIAQTQLRFSKRGNENTKIVISSSLCVDICISVCDAGFQIQTFLNFYPPAMTTIRSSCRQTAAMLWTRRYRSSLQRPANTRARQRQLVTVWSMFLSDEIWLCGSEKKKKKTISDEFSWGNREECSNFCVAFTQSRT